MSAFRPWRPGPMGARPTLPPHWQIGSTELERLVRATLLRNADRPALPWERFEPGALTGELREAVAFVLEQLCYLEAAGTDNLATLSRATPVAGLKAAYSAQILDERAHSGMLEAYLRRAMGRETLRVHRGIALGCSGGEWLQRDHVIGPAAVTLAIEHVGGELIDALLGVVEEPVLRSLLAELRKDEARHRVMIAEVIATLAPTPAGQRRLPSLRMRAARGLVDGFFRHLACPLFQRHAAPLGVDFRALYERAREDVEAVLAHEVGLHGTPGAGSGAGPRAPGWSRAGSPR